ncbi:hypothetical protein CCP2SC5_70067 [Azospirillaceae bacterium]
MMAVMRESAARRRIDFRDALLAHRAAALFARSESSNST